MFSTALDDFVIRLHPCRGVKTPTVSTKTHRVLTPTEITRLLLALRWVPCWARFTRTVAHACRVIE